MKIRRFLALVLSVLMLSSSVASTGSVNVLASSTPAVSETEETQDAEGTVENPQAEDEEEESKEQEDADEAENVEDEEEESDDSETPDEDENLEIGDEEEELEDPEAEGDAEKLKEEETSNITYVTKPAATAGVTGSSATADTEETESGGTDIQDRVLTDEMTGRDAEAEAEAEARKEELEGRILDEDAAEALLDDGSVLSTEENTGSNIAGGLISSIGSSTDSTGSTESSTGSTGSSTGTTGTVVSSGTGTVGDLTVEEVDRDEIDADLTKSGSDQTVLSNETTWDDEDMVKVIIELQGDSVIEANSDADPESAYAAYKIKMLERKQEEAVAEIEEEVLNGEELNVSYQYTWAINAIAAEVPYGTLDEIEALSSVDKVYIQEMYSVPETGDIASDETLTIGSASMTGKYDAWTAGYTGSGIKIAIIDTGIDSDHQSFAALSEDALTDDSATVQTIAGVLDKLNAYQRYLDAYGTELTAEDLYYTTKIAYGFNYCDDSLDITHDNDDQGDHGTHVAGIAAANDVEGSNVVGVAPDAQLYIMKVFGQNGGAYSEDIIAALEDAMILGADVVNMSLGSAAGFSESGDEAIDKVYANVAETKTMVLISAGNSGTFGDDNIIGGSLTSNPDNGVVSSPSTYANAISVASVDNVAITAYYVETTDGTKLAYDEGSNGGNDSMETLYGQTLEYVMIDGYGEEEDFADVDVEGKIAVVARGEISFYVKLDNAANAGAVGILVYNNVSGSISADLTGASGTIPFASISMAAGERLQSLYDEALANGEAATIYFSDEMDLVSNDTAYEISYFSSWGSDGSLRIEPDVSAPGGSIYSTLTDGEYGLMSGTSMSSPQVAGISALLQQYVKEKYPDLSASETRQMITALLLSTASPLDYDEETYYSVRQQGSGLANVYDAITTDAYLTVDGNDEPQAEVGDSEDGVYTYDFNIVNVGDSTLYYDITTTAQTEDYTTDEESGLTYMATTPINLEADTTATGSAIVLTYDYDESGATHSHDARLAYINLGNIDTAEQFRYDLDGDEDVDEDDVQAYLDALVDKNTDVDLTSQVAKVDAGETASVHVTVMVSEESKAWMEGHFENGIYVEGFTVLTAKSAGSVDLSIPYLGFYGSWSQAPMIDSGFYYMSDEELEESNMSQYYNVLFSNAAGYDDNWEPGFNPYVDEDFDVAHISLSPNGDGYVDYISDVYVSLLRNAEHLTFTFSNAEDETEVYNETTFDKVNKSYYYSGYGVCLPFIYSWYGSGYCFDGTDGNGNYLENNTQVKMTIYADLGYDDQSSNVCDTWEEIITIDTEAPTLDLDEEKTYITINEDGTQTLTLTFKDNVDVAAVNFLSKSSMVKAQYAVEHPDTKGEYVTATYDITGYGNTFYVVLGDYALNESAYLFTTTDNIPEVDESLLYGYRAYDENYSDATFYGWVSMNTDEGDFQSEVLDSEYYMDYAINAAAYVDGYVMAVAGDNKLYAITPGLWDEWTYVADMGTSISTMTYDPVNQCLWAYSDTNYALCKINVLTGELTQVGSNYSLYGVVALACDDSGILYAVHYYGYLRTINTETGEYTAEGEDNYLYYTGLTSDVLAFSGLGSVTFYYNQSMVYDAADDCLYWAAFSQSSYWGNYGGLIRLEPDFDNNTVTLTEIGIIEGNAEIVGLLKLEDRGESIIPDDAAIEGLDIEENSVTVLVNGSDSLTVNYTPWYAQPEDDLVWASEDESIATVNYYGVVTGVSVGETTVTVSTADGKFSDSCVVKVLNPDAELYGYVLYGYNGLSYQWAGFSGDAPSDVTVLTDSGAMAWTAAEYYDGSVYAFDENGDLYQINPETYDMVKLGSLGDYFYGYSVYDMAYDYSTGFMYIVDDYGYLYRVDMMTAMTEYVGYLADSYGEVALTLAISTTGTIYFITGNGFLCSYDVDTWECTDIGLTGVYVEDYYQSMTYDHNGGGIYWASIYGLYYVDPDTGSALYLGNVNGAITQITGLYTVIDEIPERPYVEVDYMYATAYSVFLLEGMTTELPVQVYPFNATDRTITWEIADESVVQISGNSLVGVSVGTTTVTGTLGDFSVTIDITVKPSTGTLNAYLLYDMSAGGAYSWITFEDNDPSSSVEVVNSSTEFTVYAGEYYNGKIYTSGLQVDESYKANAVFAVLDAETYETELYVTSDTLPYANDMAFDYSTGTLYAIGGQSNSDTTYLYMIDVKTGTYYQIAETEEYLISLACSTDGILYALDEYGCFYQMDKATAELTYIGYTGYSANMLESMAYDHDTGNLYWAQCYSDYWSGTECEFMLIDPATGAASVLGTIGSAGGEAVALFSIPENEIEIASTEPKGILFDTSSAVLYVGDTLQLSAGFTPISVVEYEGTITYASSDSSVASVDEDGLVTALKKGSVVITASCGEISGTCQIVVTDDSVVFYAFDATGIYTNVPVYQPSGSDSTEYIWYDDSSTIGSTEFAYVAYSSADKLYYALDTDDNLWSFAFDGSNFSQEQQITTEGSIIGDAVTKALEGEETDESTVYYGSLIDLTMNDYTNTLYVMLEIGIYYQSMNYYYAQHYYIYAVNTSTGELTLEANIQWAAGTPQAFTFIARDRILWFDSVTDYVMVQKFCFTSDDDDLDDSLTQLALVQNDFTAVGKLAMVYSESMNRVYMAAWHYGYYTGEYFYGLFEFDLGTNQISLIGEATYWDAIDLVLFE